MDILCKSNKRKLENEYLKLLSNFFNKYYDDTLSKDITISIDKKIGINIKSHLEFVTDIFYKLFNDLAYIISYNSFFGLHNICFKVYEIKIDDELICNIINKLNKYSYYICNMNIRYLKDKIEKPTKYGSLMGLKEIGIYKNLSHDVEGIIGNYININFSKYNYDLIELLNHKYSSNFKELYNTTKNFLFFYSKYSDIFN
tara:strand:- start:1368 stop:1967 length:600 start_codon:yes stop_codon:yes gene_type:complete